MGKAVSRLGLVAAAACALAFIYARQRSAETGKDVLSVISNLPEELKASWGEWQTRATVALDAGREAAREREAEIEESLAGEGGSDNAQSDYPF